MYKRSILLLLLNYITIYPQGNNISVEKIYKDLSEKKIKYTPFSDSFSLKEGSQKKEKQEANFLLLHISKSKQLSFKKFSDYNPNPPFYFRDSIFLYNKKYCIDNLFYEKKALKTEEPLRLNYASGYTFSLNSKDYISLFFWDATVTTSNLSYYIILFDVSDKKNIKSYFFDEQMSFTPDCFGDYNNDDKLDFINWTYENEINCYTLEGNKFKKVKNKFVKVEEISSNKFYINWKKSSWFKI